MLERKIYYAEEMITSNEYLHKKCVLDHTIDALQFILSVQDGDKAKIFSFLMFFVLQFNYIKKIKILLFL